MSIRAQQCDKPENYAESPLLPVVYPTIDDAYFASGEIKKAAGGIGYEISFTKINEAKVGDEVYIIVNHTKLKGEPLDIQVLQGEQEVIVPKDQPLTILFQGKEVTKVSLKADSLEQDPKGKPFANAGNYTDQTIVKVVLGPKASKDYTTWNNKIANCNDVAELYLKIDAHTPASVTAGCFQYKGIKGFGVDADITNHFLNVSGSWFGLKKGCDCGKSLNIKFKCAKYKGSSITQYGPVYFGSTKISAYSGWQNLLSNGKVSKNEKEIIVAVTKNEGNLDSVQSYDSEVFSVGSVQKTVKTSGKGEFPIQMSDFRNEFPKKYKELFEDCGWILKNNVLSYKSPDSPSAVEISGKKLKDEIRKGFDSSSYKSKLSCRILESIVKASKDLDFQGTQITDAKKRLETVRNIKPKGYTHKLKAFLKSNLGLGVALDHHINRPAYVSTDLGKALDNFFALKDQEVEDYNKQNTDQKQKISRDPSNWGTNHSSYETIILNDYGVNRRMSKRNGVNGAPGRFSHLKKDL